MSLKVAVIGAGHLGRIHSKLIQQVDGTELVCVADPCESARIQIAEDQGVATTADWRSLIGSIDAAIIATPTAYHHEVAAELIRNRVHLLIEKPVTVTREQAQDLIRIAENDNLRIQVGHVERFNAALAAADSVGIPRFIQCCRASGYTFRSIDVGVVLDLMIHDIDLVCHLAQSEIKEVRAVGFSVFGQNEDIAQARLQFENGLVANLSASRCSPCPQRRFELFGTQGYANIDLGKGEANVIAPPEWLTQRQFDLNTVDEDEKSRIREHLFDQIMPPQPFAVEPVNAILCEQQNWIDCIQDPSQSLRVPLQDGFRALDIATTIVEQIRAHQWTDQLDVATANPLMGPLANPAELDNLTQAPTRKVA